MLILTRRLGETLKIGDSIDVTVLGVSGNQIRLGITAPKDVSVDREEIHVRKQGEQLAPSIEVPKQLGQRSPEIIIKKSGLRAKQFGLMGSR